LPTRLVLLCATLGFVCIACLGQEICGVPKRGPSADAIAAFEKIQDAVGIYPGTILLYASSAQLVKDRSGALSIECPGGGGLERWIVYDPELIQGDGLYFALAHETAHHLNNDPMSGEPPSKQQELRADSYAARYLARPPLNWTSQRLSQALSSLPLPKDAKGLYPSLEERRAQVNEGSAAESARLHPTPDLLSGQATAKPAPLPVAGQTRTNPKDGLTYMWIPPGQFTLGCSRGDPQCESDEKKARQVMITKGFWIGQTEVTQEAYERVIAKNPSTFKGAKRPVESIFFNDANAYCQAIGGRLPTEAEWEYAARAGSPDSRYGDIYQIAWYDKNSEQKTHEVAGKAPNAWGLYDMLGNVAEWTADWYLNQLPGGASDPKGPTMGVLRSLRGGSWDSDSSHVRASSRVGILPLLWYNYAGVRCVADLGPPELAPWRRVGEGPAH
jgi:formylglycine-generating enzyme required for sulfatase activity